MKTIWKMYQNVLRLYLIRKEDLGGPIISIFTKQRFFTQKKCKIYSMKQD